MNKDEIINRRIKEYVNKYINYYDSYEQDYLHNLELKDIRKYRENIAKIKS